MLRVCQDNLLPSDLPFLYSIPILWWVGVRWGCLSWEIVTLYSLIPCFFLHLCKSSSQFCLLSSLKEHSRNKAFALPWNDKYQVLFLFSLFPEIIDPLALRSDIFIRTLETRHLPDGTCTFSSTCRLDVFTFPDGNNSSLFYLTEFDGWIDDL